MCHEYNGKKCMLDFILAEYPNWKADFKKINGRKPTYAEIDQVEIYYGDFLTKGAGTGDFEKYMADKMHAARKQA